MFNKFAPAILAASVAALASPAFSGGFIAPVTETPVVPPVAAPAPVSDWAGAYAGVGLGYVFGGDDEVGIDGYDEGDYYAGDEPDVRTNNITNLEISGAVLDARLGYRWQRNKFVFGPELSVDGGSVDDSWSRISPNSTPLPGEPLEDRASIESSMKYSVNLAFKTGYLVRPDTMIYGSAGFVHGKFDYEIALNDNSASDDYTANGYTIGLGVEHKINERISVFGEYNYRNYGKTDVVFDDLPGGGQLVTRGTPEHSIVKMGVNFSF